MQCHSGATHSAALVESTRQEMVFVLLAGWGHTTAHTPWPLLKDKPEVQCEKRSEMEVRSTEEIWERAEGAQGIVMLFLLQSFLKTTFTPQKDFRESLSRRTRESCWPQCYMHWIQLGFGLVAGFTAILLPDLASPNGPGLREWTQEAPQ